MEEEMEKREAEYKGKEFSSQFFNESEINMDEDMQLNKNIDTDTETRMTKRARL